jgi:NAD-dependent deacetylase
VLKPDVVLFGETPPQKAINDAQKAVSTSDVLLAIGTSAVVYPAAHLPVTAKNHNAKIIEINMEPTHLSEMFSDIFIQGSASEILHTITSQL